MTLRADSFYADVRATVLTGLATGTAAAIAATDTVLGALQKLQATILTLAPLASPSFTGNVNMSAKLAVQGFMLQNTAPTVAATGTTLATAKQLNNQVNVVTSSTMLTALGVILMDNSPASGYSANSIVINTTGVAINVYPPNTSSKINALANGAAFSLAANTAREFVQTSTTQFWTA